MCSESIDNNAKNMTAFELPGMTPVTKEELLRQIIEGKERYRAELAALPFEEKRKILLKLQERARVARTSGDNKHYS